MHEVRYTQVVGDGESFFIHYNNYTTIPNGRDLSKLECASHCVKCYRSHLEQLVKDFRDFKGHGNLSKSTIIKIA